MKRAIWIPGISLAACGIVAAILLTTHQGKADHAHGAASSSDGLTTACTTDAGGAEVLTFKAGAQAVSISSVLVAFYDSSGAEIGSRPVDRWQPVTLTPGQSWSNSDGRITFGDNVFRAVKCAVVGWS